MTGRLSRMRSAITGRFVNTNEADASQDTTVMETIGNAIGSAIELRVAAEAVVLGAGYELNGRTQVNQADLDRLKAALGFVQGQP